MRWGFTIAFFAVSVAAWADEVSLRVGGKEVALDPAVRERAAGLVRDMLARCGPNTAQHPHNFGALAPLAAQRWKGTLEGSRLYVAFKTPFQTVSHLGGTLQVSEAVVALDDRNYFVGPDFSRHRGQIVEHLQCEYLPALELACLAGIAAHLPPRYREACAKLERDPQGRIVMPPPDIAPSCS
jgi:hypothetical protein